MEENNNGTWGAVTNALVTAGLELPQALSLAKKLRDANLNSTNEQTLSKIAEFVVDILSPVAFKRYQFWQTVYSKRIPVSIHIMGVTGVGKTEIASALRKRLIGAEYVPTDMLRDILRTYLPKSIYPDLHVSSYQVWEVESPGQDNKDAVIRGYFRQCQILSSALLALCSWATKIGKVVIVEGVNIGPDYIAHLIRNNVPNLFAFLVVTENESQHWTFLERRYRVHPRPPVPIEIYRRYYSVIRQIQDSLIEVASKLGIPILTSADIECVVHKILSYIEDRIDLEA